MVPLDVIPTGWFQVGWSGEIAPGGVKPLRYFGQELVAFRAGDGRLAVLDAHCRHLGAHLGYGGKVRGDCIACPYHGWEWGLDGANVRIPYQEEPVRGRLRQWPAVERHGIIFVWYDPKCQAPRWKLPDIFQDFPDLEAEEGDFYPCYPHAVVDKPGEPFPVQYMMENAADTTHFKYTHGAPEIPQLIDFSIETGAWRSLMGFISPKSGEFGLKLHAYKPNIGLAYTVFDGRRPYRLILAGTPIDAATTHMRVSYFLPRAPDSPDAMPEEVLAFARSTEELYEEDARMWRHQKFVQKPVFAVQDVAGYSAFRRWSTGFYEGAPEAAEAAEAP